MPAGLGNTREVRYRGIPEEGLSVEDELGRVSSLIGERLANMPKHPVLEARYGVDSVDIRDVRKVDGRTYVDVVVTIRYGDVGGFHNNWVGYWNAISNRSLRQRPTLETDSLRDLMEFLRASENDPAFQIRDGMEVSAHVTELIGTILADGMSCDCMPKTATYGSRIVTSSTEKFKPEPGRGVVLDDLLDAALYSMPVNEIGEGDGARFEFIGIELRGLI